MGRIMRDREFKRNRLQAVLPLLLVASTNAIDVQSQFSNLISVAFESCQTVIAMCERPFVGYDIKPECSGVEFSTACRTAGCSGGYAIYLKKELTNVTIF